MKLPTAATLLALALFMFWLLPRQGERLLLSQNELKIKSSRSWAAHLGESDHFFCDLSHDGVCQRTAFEWRHYWLQLSVARVSLFLDGLYPWSLAAVSAVDLALADCHAGYVVCCMGWIGAACFWKLALVMNFEEMRCYFFSSSLGRSLRVKVPWELSFSPASTSVLRWMVPAGRRLTSKR